ncbi:MAG: hypothetical protein H0V49_08280 [Nocardioidaceae bacterium]|nr:hypothetical protein [Nocardioidaceae bacterium]
MKRLASLSAVALFTLGTLTACGSDSDEFCKQVKEADTAPSADLDPAEVQAKFDEIANSAPDELKDDFDALSEIDLTDPASLDPDSAEQITQAVENITKFAQDECGVDLG